MPQLTCKDVSIAYERVTVVSDINFEVERGDYVCVLGENGSGKSSLIKAILGLIPIQSGSIQFMENTERSRIGYLSQQTPAQRDFPASVYEVVLSGCLNQMGFRPFYGREEKQKALSNLEKLGISELKNRSYRNLSGGQQQRVLLARALCATDRMIFLDEPISGLDPSATAEFYQLIEKINKENNISVVMVSHDVETALCYANKVLYIRKKESFFGTKEEYQKSGFMSEYGSGSGKEDW